MCIVTLSFSLLTMRARFISDVCLTTSFLKSRFFSRAGENFCFVFVFLSLPFFLGSRWCEGRKMQMSEGAEIVFK